jgi:hypothetical protein
MTEVDETHICIDCTIIQEELKSQENVSKKQATEIPHKDDEKSQEKAFIVWHTAQFCSGWRIVCISLTSLLRTFNTSVSSSRSC